MNRNGLNLMADPKLDAGKQVPVQGVYAAGTKQANEVKGASALAQAGTELHQWLEIVKGAALDTLGDPDQILRNYPSGSQVEVANFAVAHLTFREAHCQSTRFEQRVRV
jgi:hypothetical protein